MGRELPFRVKGRAGKVVCSTRRVEPAVPTSKEKSPPVTAPGEKTSSTDPSRSPATSAPEISLAARTEARCWGASPGFFRPLRMLTIRNGLPDRQERPRAVRRICPPPSPRLPSISIITQSPSPRERGPRVLPFPRNQCIAFPAPAALGKTGDVLVGEAPGQGRNPGDKMCYILRLNRKPQSAGGKRIACRSEGIALGNTKQKCPGN